MTYTNLSLFLDIALSVFPSYGFWLPIWHIQTFLTNLVLNRNKCNWSSTLNGSGSPHTHCTNYINVREYRRCNKKWIFQRNWQHRVYKTKKNKQNQNTICVGHHYTQANTNNVKKTRTLLQTIGDKEEPNIVFYAEIVTCNARILGHVMFWFVPQY